MNTLFGLGIWLLAIVLTVVIMEGVREAVKKIVKRRKDSKPVVVKEDKLTKEIKELRLDIMELSEEFIDTNESIREDIAEAIAIIEEYQDEARRSEDK